MVRSDKSESDGSLTPPLPIPKKRRNKNCGAPDGGSAKPSQPTESLKKYGGTKRSSRSRTRKRRRRRRDPSTSSSNSSSDGSSSEPTKRRRKVIRRSRDTGSATSCRRVRSRARALRHQRERSLSPSYRSRSRGRPRYRDARQRSSSYESSERVPSTRRQRKYSTDSDPPTSKKHCSLSNSNSNGDKLLRKFMDMMNNKCSTSNYVGAQNVIPAFDPNSKAQSAKDWLRKVNETASIYNWREKQIVYHALPKLSGLAKRWYEGLPSVNLTWKEWQTNILNTFPDDRNYGDKLFEMLERKSRREESLEEYFYDKVTLINTCNITGRDAVDCVIHGIYDHNIKLNAQGSNFKNTSQLLKYLRSISNRSIITQVRRPPYVNRPQVLTTSAKVEPTENRFKHTKCYNCNELGHTAIRCKKTLKKCEKCSRFGHEQQNCWVTSRVPPQNTKPEPQSSSTSTSQKVLQITAEDSDKNKKYFKTVVINGSERNAYIDFGSQCSLIKASIAKDENLIMSKLGLPILKGFSAGGILPIGRVSINVKVDSIIADIEAYVVDDTLLATDVLIGQSLTELPSVVVHKTSSELYLYTDTSNIDKVKLYNSCDVTVAGTQMLAVHTDADITGTVFVPEYVCMKNDNEYLVVQGLYSLQSGHGHVIIIGLSEGGAKFGKDKLLSRAISVPIPNNNFTLNDIGTENINKIYLLDNESETAETTTKADITLEMINVGEKINSVDKSRLLVLLNKYRDCFALSTEELGVTSISEMHIRLADDTPVSYPR